MPIDLNRLFGIAQRAIGGYNTGGIGGAIGGAIGLPPGTIPPGFLGGGGQISLPASGSASAANARNAAIAAALQAAGNKPVGNGVWLQPSGNCFTLGATGVPQAVACPVTDPGAPWGGGGGDFGGGGAGGSFGPPQLPPATGGTCATAPYGMGISIVETPTYKAVSERRPGYVTVTLPFAVGGYPCGSRVQMLKEVAVKFGLYKSRRRPVLTYADMKCIRKAERVETKLKNLTTRHTDYRVVKKK